MKKTILIFALLITMLPVAALAESTFDLYFGRVNTASGTFTHTDSGGFTLSTTDSFSERPVFGMRANNWFANNPNLGLSLDMSYFRPDGEVTAVDTLPLALLFSIRFPVNSTFPNRGRWFIYVSAGPAVYMYDIHARLPFDYTFKGLGADVGLDTRAGINWKITDNMAFFIEYRHTRFDVDGTYEDFFGWVQESITMEIESDHVNFGISF